MVFGLIFAEKLGFLGVITILAAAGNDTLAFVYEQALAFWAKFPGWLRPKGEFAVGIIVAGVEGFAGARTFFYDLAGLALRALDTRSFLHFFDILAFGIFRTAEECSVAAPLYDHRSAAFIAFLVCLDRRFRLFLLALCLFRVPAFRIVGTGDELTEAPESGNQFALALRALAAELFDKIIFFDDFGFFFEVSVERIVKFTYDRDPFLFSFGDSVQVLFQGGGKLRIDDLGEVVGQDVIYEKSNVERDKFFILVLFDVFAVHDGRDRWSVR
jgi:hypothetical protein